MTDTLVWLLGGGGLLGSHVAGTLAVRAAAYAAPAPARPSTWQALSWQGPSARVPWHDRQAAMADLGLRARAFARSIAETAPRSWSVAWCAGAGVVGTPAPSLDAESDLWEGFLARLGEALDGEPRARGIAGRVLFASSAGGVWGGHHAGPPAVSAGGFPPGLGGDQHLTESSPCRPLSAYGRAKLRQEEALARWAAARSTVSTVTARVSNVYGPGQNLAKPQGLISHMIRCLIYGRPLHIYVPLDTIRDYIYVEDAARALVRSLERLDSEARRAGSPARVIKLVAAESETTISALIGVLGRMAHRRVKVLAGLHPARREQPDRLSFRSRVWAEDEGRARTNLLEGMCRTYRHMRGRYLDGALPPPSIDPVPVSVSAPAPGLAAPNRPSRGAG